MPSPPSATVDPAHRKVLLRSQSCSIGAVFLILLAGLLRIYPENSEDRHRRTKYLRLGQIANFQGKFGPGSILRSGAISEWPKIFIGLISG